MDDWIDYYDSTHTIYASRLHRDLHFQLIARDIIGYIEQPDAVVLDYSCGEALAAADVADACGTLILAGFGTNVCVESTARAAHMRDFHLVMVADACGSANVASGADSPGGGVTGAVDEAGIDAVDIYGLSEVIGPGVAMECVETKDGLHIWEDHFYPEVIDPITEEVLPDGEVGELVFTSLTKEAMPLVRRNHEQIASRHSSAAPAWRGPGPVRH